MTRIKICGMTNRDDALAAASLGADALGFIFAASPRRITPEEAREIILALPPFITAVGVFRDEPAETVERIHDFCGLNLVQLHGNEDGAYLEKLGLPAIRVFRVRDGVGDEGAGNEVAGDGGVLGEIERLNQVCFQGYFLMDTFDESRAGGTGKTFDWAIAERASKLGKVILSGGLNPENVVEALEQVRPYAVDVCSGVERAPGRKDHGKMKDLIREVRNWDSRTA
jgi:phosphoribosylanthranilate isomerase